MDHRLMLDWAVRNLKALQDAEAAFLLENPYRLWHDQDEQTGEYRVRVRFHPVPPPVDLPFKIGDVIHNARVSLDYVAFAVAMKENPSITDDKAATFQVAFPICEKSKDWGSLAGKVRRWASDDAVEAFESVQPYKRPELANHHPLLLVHRLDNPHKHRNLLSAAPAVTYIDFSQVGDPTRRFEVVRMGVEGPFVDGAVVARLRHTPPTPDAKAKAKVEIEVTFQVAFDEEGPAPMMPALETLGGVAHHIGHDVFPIMEDFI